MASQWLYVAKFGVTMHASCGMMRLIIFSLFIAVFMMFGFSRAMRRPPPVPRPLKIRHFLMTLLVIMLTAPNGYFFLLFILNPKLAITRYYVPEGFAPSWFAGSVEIASMLLGAFLCVQASLLARRVPEARPVFLWLWPVQVLLEITGFIPVAEKKGMLVAGSILFIAFFGGSGLLAFWHFQSRSSDVLFERPETMTALNRDLSR